jgi:tetratricopeptide (TPR) repeat protein
VSASAVAAHAQTAAEFLEKAQQGLTANRPDDTIREASEAIKLEPQNPTAYKLRAQAYATKLQQEPRKIGPVPPAERSVNAVKALEDLDKAISLCATDYFTYYFRGAVYYLVSELDASLADLERSARLKSDDPTVASLLGTVKKRLASKYAYEGSTAAAEARKLTDANEKRKGLDRSVELYSKALAFEPSDPETYSGRAYAYDEMEQYDLAAKDLGEVMRLSPDDVLTWYRRGVLFVKQKEYDKALADFTAPIQGLEQKSRLSTAGDFRLELGRVYILKNDADKALVELDIVVKISPRSHLAYYERGRAHALKGDAVKAEADFRKAMEIVPYHTGSVNELKKLGKTP